MMNEPISVQIYRTIILIMLIVTMIMALCVDTPSAYGLSCSSSFYSRLYFHFFHGGILHWFVNSAALLTLAFRFQLDWWQYVIALIIASAYPFTSDVPVVGLSVWIYAIIGILTPVTSYPFRVVIANVICIFIGCIAVDVSTWLTHIIGHTGSVPVIAWQAHLYAYTAGICSGLLTQPVFTFHRNK